MRPDTHPFNLKADPLPWLLERLRDMGNTVVVIEHDEQTMRTADWIVDLGPEGGDAGGHIVAQGTPEEVVRVEGSYTGRFLKRLLLLT